MMNNGLNTQVYDDYLTIEDNVYCFELTENISYYLQNIKFTGDKQKDYLQQGRYDKK